MDAKQFLEEFGHIVNAPGGVQRVRELILDLAIRGQLLPQNPDDLPASVLIERIKREKSKLLKDKKIAKQPKYLIIDNIDIPFKKPDGWAFIRLGEIVNKIGSGSTPRGGKKAYVQRGIPFLRSQNIWNNEIRLDDVAFIDKETHYRMSNSTVFSADILLNITGASLGRCALVPSTLKEANVSQHVTIIRPTEAQTREYLHLCILSPYTQRMIWKRQVGMAREGLSKKVLEQFELPLPPLAEQKRIVAKVDELMALCDKLEAQQQKRRKLQTLTRTAALDAFANVQSSQELKTAWQRVQMQIPFLLDEPEDVESLRNAIFNIAIRGYLTRRRNSNAADLVKECLKYKKDLIRQKVLKRQVPYENTQEYPFELPDNWVWVRFSEVGIFGRGKSKHRPRNDPKLFLGGKYPFIQTGDVAKSVGNGIDHYSKKYNDYGLSQSQLWPEGTLCITMPPILQTALFSE